MSASLVGSEMCIRDRQEQHTRKSSICKTKCAPQERSTMSSAAIGAAQACLLYTSDAADDM
eukprot:8247232-Alexandrium_andersonii.AAC.1